MFVGLLDLIFRERGGNIFSSQVLIKSVQLWCYSVVGLFSVRSVAECHGYYHYYLESHCKLEFGLVPASFVFCTFGYLDFGNPLQLQSCSSTL